MFWIIYRPILGNTTEYKFTGEQWFYIVLIGVLTTVTNQIAIMALACDKAGRVASLNFLKVVLGYSSDVILFGYSVSGMEFIGISTIMLCSIGLFVMKYMQIGD
jgi:uncharacterized membrane protein